MFVLSSQSHPLDRFAGFLSTLKIPGPGNMILARHRRSVSEGIVRGIQDRIDSNAAGLRTGDPDAHSALQEVADGLHLQLTARLEAARCGLEVLDVALQTRIVFRRRCTWRRLAYSLGPVSTVAQRRFPKRLLGRMDR